MDNMLNINWRRSGGNDTGYLWNPGILLILLTFLTSSAIALTELPVQADADRNECNDNLDNFMSRANTINQRLAADSIARKAHTDIIVTKDSILIYGYSQDIRTINHISAILQKSDQGRDFVNKMNNIQSWSGLSDWTIEYNLKKKFDKNKLIDDFDLTIVVELGNVTLAGMANDWWAKQSAIEDAYQAGARMVTSYIIIYP
jgi:osmotically-inducible protein OsmY